MPKILKLMYLKMNSLLKFYIFSNIWQLNFVRYILEIMNSRLLFVSFCAKIFFEYYHY